MAKLVLLLSLLWATIELCRSQPELRRSEARRGKLNFELGDVKKDVCQFSLGRSSQLAHELLKIEKNNKENTGEVLLEFKDGVRSSDRSLLEIKFFCDAETNVKIMEYEGTLEFDLYLNNIGTPYARVQYLGTGEPGTKYIIKQSGEVVYDVSGSEFPYTFIIPSNLLTEKSGNYGEQYGYWFQMRRKALMYFGRFDKKTIRASELRFEQVHAQRKFTAVAFKYDDGTIGVFPAPSIDASTTSLICKNMKDSWYAMILSNEKPLDGKIFVAGNGNLKNIFEDTTSKATYGSPPSPSQTGSAVKSQSSPRRIVR